MKPETPKSPSWIAERVALRLLGDRKARAALAIYHARRSAKSREFYVGPNIAKLNRLTPTDLNWALTQLEGVLVETVQSMKGQYRLIRLLPQFEEDVVNGTRDGRQRGQCNPFVSPDEERIDVDTEEVLALGCR